MAWYAEFATGINNRATKLSYQVNGQTIDGSLRFITAGFQLGGGLGYNPVFKNNELLLRLGPIFRYQSTNVGGYSIYYPAATQFAFPLVAYDHHRPQKTYSFGGKLSAIYLRSFKKGILAGVNGFYQTDTNSDAVYGYGVTVGKKF